VSEWWALLATSWTCHLHHVWSRHRATAGFGEFAPSVSQWMNKPRRWRMPMLKYEDFITWTAKDNHKARIWFASFLKCGTRIWAHVYFFGLVSWVKLFVSVQEEENRKGFWEYNVYKPYYAFSSYVNIADYLAHTLNDTWFQLASLDLYLYKGN